MNFVVKDDEARRCSSLLSLAQSPGGGEATKALSDKRKATKMVHNPHGLPEWSTVGS